MSEAGQKMIEGLKEAITIKSLMIENKMLAAELRQADDTALNQALTIKQLNKRLVKAVAAERERCAKIAENIYYPNEGKLIAAAIRERSNE
jgi:hypothetical protein